MPSFVRGNGQIYSRHGGRGGGTPQRLAKPKMLAIGERLGVEYLEQAYAFLYGRGLIAGGTIAEFCGLELLKYRRELWSSVVAWLQQEHGEWFGVPAQ